MSSDSNKKYKRPKKQTLQTTNPDPPKVNNSRESNRDDSPEGACPLLAKDSEWVDILQNPILDSAVPSSSANIGDEEAVLQLVECEDGPQMKPLAIMFPGLLETDPQTLEGMLTKAMSTTEVTKHLVKLGEKANFTFMKPSTRLIPKDKKWLESVTENSNSRCSLESSFFGSSKYAGFSSDYEADTEAYDEKQNGAGVKKRKRRLCTIGRLDYNIGSEDTLVENNEPGISIKEGKSNKKKTNPIQLKLGYSDDDSFLETHKDTT